MSSQNHPNGLKKQVFGAKKQNKNTKSQNNYTYNTDLLVFKYTSGYEQIDH